MYQMAAPAATAQMLALLSASPKSASVVSDELESSLDSIKRELSFVLRKKPSSIDHPDAGLGCFLDGSAKRGQVVGFYPGVVYLIGDVRHMKGYPNIDNENANLLARYDRAIIDAKDGGGIDNGDILEHTNPLALCHYINHPPQGAMPSVMPYYFNFPMDFPAEFYPYIPNVYHRCPPIWARQMDGNNILMRRCIAVSRFVPLIHFVALFLLHCGILKMRNYSLTIGTTRNLKPLRGSVLLCELCVDGR